MIKNSLTNKIIKTVFAILVFMVALLVLSRTASNGRRTENLLPEVSDTPIYVEMTEGETTTLNLEVYENISISAIELFLVNISPESKGSFFLSLGDSLGNEIAGSVIPVSELQSGSWSKVICETDLSGGNAYTLNLRADACSPFFMLLPNNAHDGFPYMVTSKEGAVSVGIDTVYAVSLKFADILYFSVPFCILVFLIVVMHIWAQGLIWTKIKALPYKNIIDKYGCDAFLILVAVTLSVGIYYRAYLNNIFITSDSSNYLREATNIVKGNGFSYDGLAGYKSWFASWPILYPLLIAVVMLITGAEAYLASKILSMIIIVTLLLIFRLIFKKDAWIFALMLLNAGFVDISHYTWSEMPFFIFILLYGLLLGRILEKEIPALKDYVLLGIVGFLTFLTRYYGLFVYFAAGLYILILFSGYLKSKDKCVFKKCVGLTVSSFISGVGCISYLLVNRIMNGYASGVSRTLWWDDYEILTNDLISSLLKEFFNIFYMKIPQFIENFSYPLKLWVVWLIIFGLFMIIRKPILKLNKTGVWIVMGIIYYVMFVAIRYVSSMDTFYFRFFLPGTFLICLGIFDYLIPFMKEKKIQTVLGFAVTIILILDIFSLGGAIKNEKNNYYEKITDTWAEEYSEIPQKSVVIFSTLDFRSIYFRPDVVSGGIDPSDTMESIKDRYYGSDNMVILRTDALTMVSEPLYDAAVENEIKKALEKSSEDDKYIVVGIR